MYLPALSLGYAVPDGNFAASVHSVFPSALNLRLDEEGRLLTLVVSGEADLPQGLRLATPEGFSFEDFRLGDLAICRDGILHFDNNSLVIQLSGARRWRCDLPALEFDPMLPAAWTAWGFVWEALNRQQKLSKAEIVAEELFQGSKRAGIAREAGLALGELIAATRQYCAPGGAQSGATAAALQALVGLGSGLTPSGDDLLVGYLAGLWCTVQNRSERAQFLSDLGKGILSLSAQTNDISRTYLYHAARGQVSSRLADLAAAVCHRANPGQLSRLTEAAFQVGHTSGMDTVTGLLVGLAAWQTRTFYRSTSN